ncbi:TetR/AcrR family transcriptional regulator [Actinocorallia longicatena]|uniref:TetR/AcrR family transcriptional regulator n=1 Tax=Actinocorallia longicatena TaxID=111803 RepID=A0ABP6PX57_9ACTN
METRERLLAAAARVFSEHGYTAGTTNRIAEAAGHSIGSLYQYFPNKDAILLELATAHARSGIAAMEELLAWGPLPETMQETIRLFVRAAIDNHRHDPALHRVLFEQAPRSPEFLEFLREAEARAVTLAESLLTSDPSVTVADPAMAARLVVITIESAVHRYVTGDGPHRLAHFEDELVTLLTRYLTLPAGSGDESADRAFHDDGQSPVPFPAPLR